MSVVARLLDIMERLAHFYLIFAWPGQRIYVMIKNGDANKWAAEQLQLSYWHFYGLSWTLNDLKVRLEFLQQRQLISSHKVANCGNRGGLRQSSCFVTWSPLSLEEALPGLPLAFTVDGAIEEIAVFCAEISIIMSAKMSNFVCPCTWRFRLSGWRSAPYLFFWEK